jgi:hypothetical protein
MSADINQPDNITGGMVYDGDTTTDIQDHTLNAFPNPIPDCGALTICDYSYLFDADPYYVEVEPGAITLGATFDSNVCMKFDPTTLTLSVKSGCDDADYTYKLCKGTVCSASSTYEYRMCS